MNDPIVVTLLTEALVTVFAALASLAVLIAVRAANGRRHT